jgi:MFS family permease
VWLLDVSIVNTALPSIQRGLHESFSQLQWVIDAYSLAFAVLLLSAGALADRHGRKRLFLAGMAVFALGSLLCGLSTSAVELEAARVLQGIGGAALAPASLALLGIVVGIGFGLMLSPLSTAALNAVARERSGLASSVANTTRQTGNVIGIALLGALVQTRTVAAAAAASLHSLPASVAAPLAGLLGHGGPQAPLPAALPAGYSAARLHQIAASAYVTGIHGSYAVGGIVLLVAAAVAAVAFRPTRSAAPAVSPDPVSLDSVTPDRVEPAVAVD